MRAFLSTIGIAIGVATLMTIYGLTAGLTSSFTRQLAALGSNTLYVSSRPWVIRGDWWRYRNRPPITREDAAALRRRGDRLAAVAPVANAAAEVSYRGERIGQVQVQGTTSEYIDTSTIKMASGRFLSPLEGDGAGQVAVIGSAQSAAEMVQALQADLPNCDIAWIMRTITLRSYEANNKFTERFGAVTVAGFVHDLANRRAQHFPLWITGLQINPDS